MGWRAIVPSIALVIVLQLVVVTQRTLLPYNYQRWQVCREICHGVFVGCARSIGVRRNGEFRRQPDEFR